MSIVKLEGEMLRDKLVAICENMGRREARLLADAERMSAALHLIESISAGSTTANSLPHINNIARAALGDTQ